MKTILFAIICIISLLRAGDPTITFKPFPVSLPGRYRALGILLFFPSMAVYAIGEYTGGYEQGSDDGVRKCIGILKKKWTVNVDCF